jgi:hypothetical protein
MHCLQMSETGWPDLGLGSDQLFGTSMQESDVRIDAFDHFTIELKHEPQDAMRRRMLRPENDGESSQAGDCWTNA